MDFLSTVASAANQSLNAGTISKTQHEQLTAVVATPTGQAAVQGVLAHLIAAGGGTVGALGSINWANLIQQIIAWLPMIMQIISIIHPTPVPNPIPVPPAPPAAPQGAVQGATP